MSLEKCTAFDGDAEQKCKDQADADYDAAKANARVAQDAVEAEERAKPDG